MERKRRREQICSLLLSDLFSEGWGLGSARRKRERKTLFFSFLKHVRGFF
jgi:hypothetical protein